MKKTLKTALASLLAASLAASAAAFGSSAAAPDRSFADTDTAYAELTNGELGTSDFATNWSDGGMTLSLDANVKAAENESKLNFTIRFTVNGKRLELTIYRDKEIILKYDNKDYYHYYNNGLNTLFGGKFDFNQWHNYKIRFVENEGAIADVKFTIDGKELTAKESNLPDVLGETNVTWCVIKYIGNSDDEFLIDNINITGKDKTLTVDFEESAGIFTEFAEITKIGNGIYGDLNQNDKLDIIDLIKIKKLSAESDAVITDDINALADMADDGVINALDAAALRNALLLQ